MRQSPATAQSIPDLSHGLPQIANQCPSYADWKHQPSNNAMFIGMRGPSYQPHVAVDRLDVHAFGKDIWNDDRLTQGRFVVNHGVSLEILQVAK